MRAISTFLLVLLLASGARADLPRGLAGYWRGSVAEAGVELPVDIRLDPADNGFEIAITLPRTLPFKATLVPAAAPGVFEEAQTGGLFSFFRSGRDRSVLDGRPLLWARRAAEGIIAYRLQIGSSGDVEFLRIALAPSADGLEVTVERRLDGVAQPGMQGVLQRRS